MAKRVLMAYKFDSPVFLGDKIRITEIINALKASDLQLFETRIPAFTRWQFDKCLVNSVPFHRTKFLSSRNGIKKITSFLQTNSTINVLSRAIRKFKPDVVLAETSSLGWVSAYVCNNLSVPCIVDCHGLEFAESRGVGGSNWRQIKKLEQKTFENSSYLSVVSEKMRDYITSEFKVSANKIVVAPNGSNLKEDTAEFKYPLNVIYAGHFIYWEGVYDYLELAKNSTSAFKFYLAGNGPLRTNILNKIEQEHIPISYLGHIPRNKMPSLLSQMQIGIAPSSKDLTRIVASPIKVYDYLASGLPVVTPNIGDWGGMINEFDCGFALSDDTIDSYIQAINYLSNKDGWVQKSDNAKRVISTEYNWKKTLQPLINLISRLET
jgi:glycosyltransferase involved in cell wall biosynthesis